MGIWFYEEEEADKVEAVLHQVLASYPGSPSAPQQVRAMVVPPLPRAKCHFDLHQRHDPRRLLAGSLHAFERSDRGLAL